MLRTLLIMIALGWLAACTPFRGDQALFTNYARSMSEGKVLYRDLWDVTNPGVYTFYFASGSLFGFHEDGIHLGEWLWFTAFVFALGGAMVQRYKLERWPQSPAILVGAWYYFTSCADPSHLTKAEGLVAFPLFASVWALTQNRWPWWLLAGAMAGLAISFKFAFALCVLAAWLPILLQERQTFVRRGLTALLGMTVVLGAFAAYFGTAEAFEALFVTPREILKHAEPAEFSRLALSLRWFVETGTPLLVLAAAGSLPMRSEPLVRGSWCMLPAALIVILMQRWSWWTYHFLLLSLPLAVLAAYTWPTLQAKLEEKLPSRKERLAAYLVMAVLFLAPLGHGAMSAMRSIQSRTTARETTGTAYRIAIDDTRWLAEARPGPIFVAGDPLFFTMSGREASSRFHGWSLELFTPALWDALLTDLQNHPPEFIFVSKALGYEPLIRSKAPALWTWLEAHYRFVHVSSSGTWYDKNP